MHRQIAHTILASLLLITTMGMAVSKHYCGENLVSVSFFDLAETCCDDMGCCHTDNEFFRIKDDFSIPANLAIPALSAIDIPGHDLFKDFNLNVPETAHFAFNAEEITTIISNQKALALKQVFLL